MFATVDKHRGHTMVAGSLRKPLLGHERPLAIYFASRTAILPIHGSMAVHIGDMND